MKKALLSHTFQHAIPSFPSHTGFEVINFFQSCRHPRDAVVLCERGDDYVVWSANMVEGGCHNGYYVSDFGLAWENFKSRAGRLS
jgi:hypothetical protein